MMKLSEFYYLRALGRFNGMRISGAGVASQPAEAVMRYRANRAEADRRGIKMGDYKSVEGAEWLK